MIKKNPDKTNYPFLLKYLRAISALSIIPATAVKYSAAALAKPLLTSVLFPAVFSPIIQSLIVAGVMLALFAYTMSFVFCNNNTRTTFYENQAPYYTGVYNYNTPTLFWGNNNDRYTQHFYTGPIHGHDSTTIHTHGGGHSHTHGHR